MSGQDRATVDRYGPAGFIAAVATIAVVETSTWVWLPYVFVNLLFFGAASVVALVTGFFMSQAAGKCAQVGRGILIGWLATPLTIALTTIPPTIIYQVLLRLQLN